MEDARKRMTNQPNQNNSYKGNVRNNPPNGKQPPNRRVKQPQDKPLNNQQKQNVQEPLWLELLKFISMGANTLGELIISDKFVGLIQRIFQEHLDFLNYILTNYSSKRFWSSNLFFSLTLTLLFFFKGLLYKTTITFEIFLVMSIISFVALKFQNSKGDVIEVSPETDNYKVVNKKKRERSGEHPTDIKDESILNPYQEIFEEPDINNEEQVEKVNTSDWSNNSHNNSGFEFIDEDDLVEEPEEIPEEEREDLLQRIQQISRQCRDKREEEPSVQALNEALKYNDSTRQKLQFNQVLANLQQRGLIEEAMDSLKDVTKTKNLNDKYNGLI